MGAGHRRRKEPLQEDPSERDKVTLGVIRSITLKIPSGSIQKTTSPTPKRAVAIDRTASIFYLNPGVVRRIVFRAIDSYNTMS